MCKKLLLIFGVLWLLSPSVIFAQTSCCSTQGGENYCDYATSKLYCKDGTVSTACSCRLADTPTPSPTALPTPTGTPALSPTPACPVFSTFDSSKKVCGCNNGYVVSDQSCVTYNQYCWGKLGGNSTFNTSNNTCTCTTGYVLSDNGASCIPLNQVCINKLGNKSYYNSDENSCSCFEGYAIQNNQCQLIPTAIPITPKSSNQIIPTNTPIPKSTPIPKQLFSPTPIPTPFTLLHSLTPQKNTLTEKDYVTVKNTSHDYFGQLVQAFWNFITHLW